MHLGCVIGQMAHTNCHGCTFWKTVRPSGRIGLPSGAQFQNVCVPLLKFSLIFVIFKGDQHHGILGNFEISFSNKGTSTF